jgi:hypothetical protein
MRNVFLQSLTIAAAAASLVACGSTTTESGGDSSGGSNPPPATTAPDFPENSGQAAKSELAYPAGPWGYKTGSIIHNYKFIGFADPSVIKNATQAIELAQFFNPHADDATYVPESPEKDDRLFQANSPYPVGTPKPKALAIDAAAVWCGPCNQEAKVDIPPLHAKYKPMGGEFLLLLTDGPTQGVPATQKNLVSWTTKYKVDFPATLQPGMELGKVFSDNAFPTNMIINTRNMKIVKVIAGVPDASYWTLFEKTINGG